MVTNKWRSEFDLQEKRMKIFFRIFMVLWVLVALFIVSLFGVIGYMTYTIITDPGVVGSYVGEIVNGVKETVK